MTRSRPTPEPDAPLWRLGDGAPPEGRFVALAPGTEVAVLSLALPPGLSGAARLAVANRQVQDRLGQGHTLRPLGTGAFSRGLVVRDETLSHWRGALGGAAARAILLPDYLALPLVQGGWCVEVEAGIVRARLGPDDGFSAEPALACLLLQQALAQAGAGAGPLLLRRGDAEPSVDSLLAGLPAAPNGVRLANGEAGADLLRDAAGAAAPSAVGRWALVAGLVLAGALGWSVAQALAIRSDRDRAGALTQVTLDAVRRDLIASGPIVDLRAQVERAIAQRRAGATGSADALDILRRAAPVLAGSTVLSLSLGAEGVGAEMTLTDFAALDTLLADLGAAGIAARVLRSGLGEGGIAVSLTLEARP
jgi:general secretion pathway protein L